MRGAPLTLRREANAGGRLSAAIARTSAVKAVRRRRDPALSPFRFPLPCVVRLTRLGGRELDDDNLRRAVKAVRDTGAAWLGVDDADPRARWRYRQRPADASGGEIRVTQARRE